MHEAEMLCSYVCSFQHKKIEVLIQNLEIDKIVPIWGYINLNGQSVLNYYNEIRSRFNNEQKTSSFFSTWSGPLSCLCEDISSVHATYFSLKSCDKINICSLQTSKNAIKCILDLRVMSYPDNVIMVPWICINYAQIMCFVPLYMYCFLMTNIYEHNAKSDKLDILCL